MVNPTDRVQRVDELARLWFAGNPPAGTGPFLAAPTGDVTLLFCDVEGSTSLWERDPDLTRECLLAYDVVVREGLLRCGGYEVKTEGDSFMIAFPSPELAVRCAVEVKDQLARQPWPERLLAQPEACEERGLRGLRVRMGVHRCAPEPRPDAVGRMDYFGPGVNRAARVMSAAYGGQVLVDASTLAACETTHEWQTRSLGSYALKGISTEIELFEVSLPNLPVQDFTTDPAGSARRC